MAAGPWHRWLLVTGSGDDGVCLSGGRGGGTSGAAGTNIRGAR